MILSVVYVSVQRVLELLLLRFERVEGPRDARVRARGVSEIGLTHPLS